MERKYYVLPLITIILFAFGLIFTTAALASEEPIMSNQTGFVEDEIVVRFQPNITDQAMTDIVNEFSGSIEKHMMGPSYRLVRVPEGEDTDAIVLSLNARPETVFAEKNVVVQTSMVPNDPLYQYQWNMDQLNMPQAWDQTSGNNVVVAVIDTGVAYEDYGGFRKVSDLANTNFVPGYNFVNDTTHANDDHYHGTHVAGTIAQSTNNNLGVAGVSYGASIMPVKVLNTYGYGSTADVADGIRFAADNGAKVINMSLGSEYPSQTMEDAVNYARNTKNVVVVASAGNSGGSLGYPARYDSVISVAATDYNQDLSYYSSRGTGLDISAPGGDTRVDRNGDGQNDGIMQQTIGYRNPSIESYQLFQGTSMAAPHVAGAAAMVIANGETDAGQVIDDLKSSAKDLGSPGYDTNFGYGLVDVASALDVEPPVTPLLTNPTSGEELLGGKYAYIRWNNQGGSGLKYNIEYTTDYSASSDFSDGFESGSLSSAYQQGGNAPWALNGTAPHAGANSVKSGAVGNNQSSELSITKNISTSGTVTFWYKVSSEQNYDYLNFYIDGVRQNRWSGSVGWNQVQVPVTAGQHQFKWAYEKDYSVVGGSDAAWVDDIEITNTSPTNWQTLVGETAAGATSYRWLVPEIDSDNVRVRVRAKSGNTYSDWSESETFSTYQIPFSTRWWDSGAGNWEAKASKKFVGDFDGDGKDDLGIFYGYGGARSRLFVFRSSGNGLRSPEMWWDSGPGNWEAKNSKVVAGDFNGDDKEDIGVFYNYGRTTTRLWVLKSTGSRFSSSKMWWYSGRGNWEWSATRPTVGDFNNDGRDDIAIMYGYSGARTRLFVMKSRNNDRFSSPGVWWDSGPGNWEVKHGKVAAGDFNGDGRHDLAVLYNLGGNLTNTYVFKSSGSRFGVSLLWWSSGRGNWNWSSSKPAVGDINDDGKDDLAILYNYGGSRSALFSLPSRGSSFSSPAIIWDSGPGRWSWSNSTLFMGDFDGNGRDKAAIFYDHGNTRSSFNILGYE